MLVLIFVVYLYFLTKKTMMVFCDFKRITKVIFKKLCQKFVIINMQFYNIYSVRNVTSELHGTQPVQSYITSLNWRDEVPLKVVVNEEAVVNYERPFEII